MSQTEIYVFQIIFHEHFSIIIWGPQMYTNNAYLNNSTIDRKDKIQATCRNHVWDLQVIYAP